MKKNEVIVENQIHSNRLIRKKTNKIIEQVKYYCACCNSECMPIKSPIIENKIVDKIVVSF